MPHVPTCCCCAGKDSIIIIILLILPFQRRSELNTSPSTVIHRLPFHCSLVVVVMFGFGITNCSVYESGAWVRLSSDDA